MAFCIDLSATQSENGTLPICPLTFFHNEEGALYAHHCIGSGCGWAVTTDGGPVCSVVLGVVMAAGPLTSELFGSDTADLTN